VPKHSAICVQRFDDSRNSAIHITYRISLRSSSLREPRDPLSKVVFHFTIKKSQTKKISGLYMVGPFSKLDSCVSKLCKRTQKT
jgi:hypothetical protein